MIHSRKFDSKKNLIHGRLWVEDAPHGVLCKCDKRTGACVFFGCRISVAIESIDCKQCRFYQDTEGKGLRLLLRESLEH